MRTAVFSDVHGNLEALEAVRRAGRALGVERWLCLGDVVGYGADPSACLAATRRLADVVLLGNHDAAVAGVQSLEYFSAYARRALEWTRRRLSADEVGALRGLALTHREGDAFFVHASPDDPAAWRYVQDEEDAAAAMAGVDERLLFVGHAHVAFACAVEGERVFRVLGGQGRAALAARRRYLVNVGSVGQPRDGDARACFAVRDDGADAVELVRAEYDVAAAQRKIRGAGLPAFLADRLDCGC